MRNALTSRQLPMTKSPRKGLIDVAVLLALMVIVAWVLVL